MNTTIMERELLMKEFGIKYGKTKDEEVKMDYDEFIEDELSSFRKLLKPFKSVRELNKFENWFKLYKVLNYDIFNEINIEKVDKINNYCAAVTLRYKNKIEHDLIRLNPQNLLCEVYRYNDNKVLDRVIRRALIPANCNEALIYFERKVKENERKAITKIFNELKSGEEKSKINNDVKINDKSVGKIATNNKNKEPIKETDVKKVAKEKEKQAVKVTTSVVEDTVKKLLSSLTSYEKRIWDKHIVNPDYIRIEKILERKMLNNIKKLNDTDKIKVISEIKFSRISNPLLKMREATVYLSKIN